jgi:hypothetical protein
MGERTAVSIGAQLEDTGDMAEPKFSVGEKVYYSPDVTQDRHSGEGLFEVLREMPKEIAGNSYRIRSETDGHERIAREHQLEKTA